MSSEIEDAINAVLKSRFPVPVRASRRIGVRHPGRRAAKAEKYVCHKIIFCAKCGGDLTASTACHLAQIFYPPGVPKIGCGRNFATKHG